MRWSMKNHSMVIREPLYTKDCLPVLLVNQFFFQIIKIVSSSLFQFGFVSVKILGNLPEFLEMFDELFGVFVSSFHVETPPVQIFLY